MDTYTYNCHYCGVQYTPKRRFKQKYCCNSCRVNAFTRRKRQKQNLPPVQKVNASTQIEKMSWPGIGNAAVGTLATNVVTNWLTKEENKPATKGDIQKLLVAKNQRFSLVKNMPIREDGAKPLFDNILHTIIYIK
jgi:hypothetical protein